MKNLILALSLLTASSSFAATNIFCSQGDYDSKILVDGRTATVRTCNTDWGCGSWSNDVYTLSDALSDAKYQRFVDAKNNVQLEISRSVSTQKEVQVNFPSVGMGGGGCFLQ